MDIEEISKILLPLNPSQNLDNAQEYTLWLAEVLEAKIIPLYVVPDPQKTVGMTEVTEIGAVDEALKSIGENKLRTFGRETGEVQHDSGILKRGDLVDTILEVANEEEVSLIVLSGFSSRFSRTLLGSEVERIVEYSEASVLVLREEHSVPRSGQRLLVPFSGTTPQINACRRIVQLAEKFQLSVSFVAVSHDTDETQDVLGEVRRDWYCEIPECCEVDIAIDVRQAKWPLGQRKLSAYGIEEESVAMVVLPRIYKGERGDTSTDLLQLFVNQSVAPVLIIH